MVTIDLWEPSITILGEEVPPQPGSILLLTPGAAYGNRYFFFTNSFLGYPVVREYRLVPTESMG